MSNRNSHANKQAARERLRVERERQAKKEKVRRQLTVAGSIVVVLAVAGGIGYAITKATGGSDTKVSNTKWKKDAGKKTFAKPANTTDAKGTTLVIGDAKAKNTLQVFEDMRCPVCAQFEQLSGETVTKGMQDGSYKLQFTMGTFLDDNRQISGSGSKNALSALGAALDVSPEAFLEYKKALYSAKHHPEETEDEFSDDKKLIEIAQEVKELKGNKEFEKAVNNGTYDQWAIAMGKSFNKVKDITGTPSLKLNGTKLQVDGRTPMTPQELTPLLEKNLKK